MYTQINKQKFKTLKKDPKKSIMIKIFDEWDEVQDSSLTLP